MVSVVVNTCNESAYLKDCLDSVRWADEIVVIDMESTDDSVQICREYTDRILTHPRLPAVEPARNFGLSQANGEWVLVLDPDERVSAQLADTIRKIEADPASADGYMVPFTTRMFGRSVRHSGWGDEEHVRLVRRGRCFWPEQVHKVPSVDGRVGRIPRESGCIVHENYRSISHFLEKMNRYTGMEAKRLYSEGRPFHWLKLFYQPGKEFFHRYVTLKGYKDGIVGLVLGVMMAFYIQASYIKLWEMYQQDRISAANLQDGLGY